MNVRHLSAIAMLAALTTAAQAQDPRDPRCLNFASGVVEPDGSGGDACQKAVDLFNYITPQLGSALAGGNATLGQGGTLGGPGKFTVLLRVTALRGALPDGDAISVNGGPADVSSTYDVQDAPLPLPSVDAALGVFSGIPLGITNVLGADLLGSVFYMPSYSDDETISIETPEGSFAFGYGVRVGVIGETSLLPAVSLTWMKRKLPRTSISITPSDIDDIALGDFDNRATSWRLVAGKKLGLVAISAGYGKDEFESSALLSWDVQQGTANHTSGSFEFNGREVKATNMFANVLLNLQLVKLVGEVGQIQVDNVSRADFFNQFSQDPDKARMYASVGFRIGNH